jgi:hypothetical protein
VARRYIRKKNWRYESKELATNGFFGRKLDL